MDANGESGYPAISADGRFVAFQSSSSNLVAGDTNGQTNVFVVDRSTGATELVSKGLLDAPANNASAFPAISADGRFVAYWSEASNLVPEDTNGYPDIFLFDRQSGTTIRVDVGPGGEQTFDVVSFPPSVSADGRFVAFASAAPNLVSHDTNRNEDVFVFDRDTGALERVSVRSSGKQAWGGLGSFHPSLSASGRFVAFHSFARNLVPDDTNEAGDVFVHDRKTGETTRISVGPRGEGNASSLNPSTSKDGRFRRV